jgi:hypothetical protein
MFGIIVHVEELLVIFHFSRHEKWNTFHTVLMILEGTGFLTPVNAESAKISADMMFWM